jgi:hypothetical protein
LLKAILAQAAEWDKPADGTGLARMMPNHLETVVNILVEASDRAERVDRHARKYKWPKWQKRMASIKAEAEND